MTGSMLALVVATALGLAARATAQSTTPTVDSLTQCDSLLAAARKDSVARALSLSVERIDGGELARDRLDRITHVIGTALELPRPLRVPVFEGPAQMVALRRRTSDTTAQLRAPVVTGVYRFTWMRSQELSRVEVARASLVPALDSAMLSAIKSAFGYGYLLELRPDEDSVRLEARITTDTIASAVELTSGFFPRMPIIDAVPLRDNRQATIPDGLADEDLSDVVLRFVIDADGIPNEETVEVVRARSIETVRAAFIALADQRFTPARVRGCPVQQQVEYPFAFVKRPDASQAWRH